MKVLLFLAFLTLACSSSGCTSSSDPDSNTNPPATHTVPKAGSTFIFELKNRQQVFFDTAEVIATGLEIHGRKNVSRIRFMYESSYLSYEDNGDLAVLWDTQDTLWIPFPIASKKQLFLRIDSLPQGEEWMIHDGQYTPFRERSVAANNSNVNGYEIEEIVTERKFNRLGHVLYTNKDSTYYTLSNSIGFFTMIRYDPGDPQFEATATLKSYSLK